MRSKKLGYTYGIIFSLLFVIFSSPLYRTVRYLETSDPPLEKTLSLERTRLSSAEVRKEIDAIRETTPDHPGPPQMYWFTLARLDTLLAICEIRGRDDGYTDEVIAYRNAIVSIPSTKEIVYQSYVRRYGMETLQANHTVNWPNKSGVLRPWDSARKKEITSVWKQSYLLSLPLIFLYFCLRLKELGFSLLLEILRGWRVISAVLFWPIGIWIYPNGDPAKQLVSAMRFLIVLLASSFSFGTIGAAYAKTPEPNSRKRKSWTLQVDGRNSVRLNHPVTISPFLRTTLETPQGFVVENISTSIPSAISEELVGGYHIYRNHGLIVNGVGGGTLQFDSRGNRNAAILGGTQVFLSRSCLNLRLSVLRFERQLVPIPRSSFAYYNQILVRRGSIAFGGEGGLRKSAGKSPQWQCGPTIEFRRRGTASVEGAFLLNSQGERLARIRLMHAFTW